MITAEEFWKNASEEEGCLIWKGPTNPIPLYGIFHLMGARLIAHRVAYELTHGDLPKNAHVVKSCNNPLCVKPEHLKLANSLKATDPSEDLKFRIKSCIEVVDECWRWKGKKPKTIALPTGHRLLARAIYELFNKPLRKSQDLNRICQDQDCYNPSHLAPIERSKLGEANAKLTIEDVKAIREAVIAGPINVGEMAKKYKTSRQTIHSVVYNRGWYDADYAPPERVTRLKRPKSSVEDRFWKKVDKSQDCWIWTAYSYGGFGHFTVDQSPKMAHRVSYELTYGEIPQGMKIYHTCDNDLCVRPDHLCLKGKKQSK